MKQKTKVTIPISIDRKLENLIKDNITNKSKYIEWLIYQNLLSKKIDGIDKIFI